MPGPVRTQGCARGNPTISWRPNHFHRTCRSPYEASSMSEEYDPQRSIRVAAVQSQPQLGDVDANLENVRKLVRRAFSAGAQWVVLPEFFTTGIIFDDSLLAGHRPLDGAPMQLLKELAREGGATVGGSYLAESGRDVYNTFVLRTAMAKSIPMTRTSRQGRLSTPTMREVKTLSLPRRCAAYGVQVSGEPIPSRQANNQAGVFALPDLNVGAALCWEMIRRRTVTRMVGKVDMVLACSAWPSLEPEWGFPGMSQEQIVGLNANLLVMLQMRQITSPGCWECR